MDKLSTKNKKDLNPIGIGTWMIGGGWDSELSLAYADYDNDQESIEAIQYSIKNGQNHIDTAFLYGTGHSEEVVGEAIKPFVRGDLFIASKVWKTHSQRKAIVPHVEGMLKRLQTDYLDLIYIHSSKNPFPMEEYIAGLNDVVDLGLAKGLAVSNFNLEELKQAESLSKHPILANQILYNILERKEASNDLLSYCRRKNIAIVAYSPVERGLLGENCNNEVVLGLAQKYGKTPAQIALNWLISQKITYAIPKAIQKEHIDQNIDVSNFTLQEEDIVRLNQLA